MIRRSAILLAAFFITFLAPAMALADDSQIFAICKTNPKASICADQGTNKDPVLHVIQVAANLIAIIAGVAAVILIIISGISMITSGGNQEAVAGARRRITAAIVGLVIIALAWTIIKFFTDRLIT